MSIPSALEPQPFFLVADAESGEIYCAHQEYSVNNRRLLSRCRDEERILAIAMKANPSSQSVRDNLKIFPVVCAPTINFARHLVDLETGHLIERKRTRKGETREAIAMDFEEAES